MPRKMLHRISRIFNHKESITAIEPDPHVITAHITPITLQRAPSSKLLIDDYMDITLDYNYDYYQEPKQQPEQIVIMGSCKRSDHHRQSWITNLSKLKSLKKHSSNKKLKSNDCWFNQREVGEMIEIPDHHEQQQQQQQQQGVSETPLSLASSLYSTTNQINPLLSSSLSSSWLPIEEDNTSTARTSLDSQRLIKIDFSSLIHQEQQSAAVEKKQVPTSSNRMNLAENVKHILGDAIFLADQELDI